MIKYVRRKIVRLRQNAMILNADLQMKDKPAIVQGENN
jgi:hypothetical protein